MIYRCSSKDCGYWCEGEMLEGAACPWCGKELLRAEEKNMSGDDWAALGGFWSEQGAKGKTRMAECFRKAAYLGSAWGTCNLGICMEQGDGVERNPEQAFWLYSQAMEMDYNLPERFKLEYTAEDMSARKKIWNMPWRCTTRLLNMALPVRRCCWPGPIIPAAALRRIGKNPCSG